MDKTSSQPDHFLPPEQIAANVSEPRRSSWIGLSKTLARDLWLDAEGEACGLELEEFVALLTATGERFNFDLPPGTAVSSTKKASFLRGLQLADLALANACALGREAAQQRFLRIYRTPITEAAILMTGADTTGRDLASSLCSELCAPIKKVESSSLPLSDKAQKAGGKVSIKHDSPLSSYSGRGSLLSWLRAMLALRSVARNDNRQGESSTGSAVALDIGKKDLAVYPTSAGLADHTLAVAHAVEALDAEDRFVLSAHFVDGQSPLQIAHTLHADVVSISRRIKQLAVSLHDQMSYNLQTDGLSKRSADEALGALPLDFAKNLHSLLKTSETSPVTGRTATLGSKVQPMQPGHS